VSPFGQRRRGFLFLAMNTVRAGGALRTRTGLLGVFRDYGF
jgi:hypothetical protein